MDLQLTGRHALVTGSTAGIGFAIAKALAREGARVIVTGRTEVAVTQAVAAIREAGPAIRPDGFFGDLSQPEIAASIVQRFPNVEILVNNLGIFEAKAFEDIADEEWMRFFRVNVLSGARLARLYLPAMRKAKRGSHYLYLERECRADSGGDDPLWRYQDRLARAISGSRRSRGWDRDNRQQHTARTH